jgi:hypothetical protein
MGHMMMGANYKSGPLDEMFYAKSIGAQLNFTWLPVTCAISKKRLWLTYAYRMTAMYRGGTDLTQPFMEHRWFSKEEYIIWRLKQ